MYGKQQRPEVILSTIFLTVTTYLHPQPPLGIANGGEAADAFWNGQGFSSAPLREMRSAVLPTPHSPFSNKRYSQACDMEN